MQVGLEYMTVVVLRLYQKLIKGGFMMKKLLVLLMSFGLVFSVYSSDQWTKANPTGATNLSDLDASITANNAALDRLLIEYRGSAKIEYASTSTITVTSGQVACSNSAGSVVRWRRNTSDTTVSWTMLDTSSEVASTTYYLWAVADTDVATFTVTISTSSTAPSGKTYYAKLGQFYNNSSSNILDDNTLINDNDNLLKVSIGTGTVANGGTIPLPSGYTHSQCKWTVSVNTLNHYDRDWAGTITHECSVNSSRVVTIYGYNSNYGGYVYGTVNYIIIGQKP